MSTLTVREQANGWHLLRLQIPALAAQLAPGQSVQVDGVTWPVMRVNGDVVECLHRAPAPAAEAVITGPCGSAFAFDDPTARALLLGDVAGLAALLHLTDTLRCRQPRVKVLLLLAVTAELPFRAQPSRLMVPGLPADVIAAIPLLDDWNVPSRLANPAGQPGCYDGPLIELAQHWLDSLQGAADVTLYGCGGLDLLHSVQQLADARRLPARLVAAP